MKQRQKLLTDEQWELIELLFPKRKRRVDGRGRPLASNRACFEGLLWILQTGAAWRFLPDEYPSLALDLLAAAPAVAGRRRLAGRVARSAGRTGAGRTIAMGRNLPRWQLRSGEKRGLAVGKTKRGKGTKWMVLSDGEGVPLGVRLESASPAEVTLAEDTLAEVRVPRPKGRPR